MPLSKDEVAEMSARQRIRALDAQDLGYDERRAAQDDRAAVIARQLAGADAPRGLVRVLLALVEADERPEPPQPPCPGPAPGARQVLKRRKSAPAVLQEVLW
jgi:hypothetical protein